MPSDEQIRAKLGDEGVRASWHLYDAYNEAEHAYRMTDDARHRIGDGDVVRAIEALRIAQAAADKAVYRIRDSIAALEALPKTEPSE